MGEVGEGWSTPQPERPTGELGCGKRVAAVERSAGLVRHAFEPERVDTVRLDAKEVAGWARLEDRLAAVGAGRLPEQPPQLGHLLDYDLHPPTTYFPLLVDEALMIEPTETESREDLDDLVTALTAIVAEARTEPDLLRDAPVKMPVRRLDEAEAARHPVVTQRFTDDQAGPPSESAAATAAADEGRANL